MCAIVMARRRSAPPRRGRWKARGTSGCIWTGKAAALARCRLRQAPRSAMIRWTSKGARCSISRSPRISTSWDT
jgi:hypothetical protein